MLDLTSVNLKKLLRPGPSSEAGQTHALELDLSDASQTSHRWKLVGKVSNDRWKLVEIGNNRT